MSVGAVSPPLGSGRLAAAMGVGGQRQRVSCDWEAQACRLRIGSSWSRDGGTIVDGTYAVLEQHPRLSGVRVLCDGSQDTGSLRGAWCSVRGRLPQCGTLLPSLQRDKTSGAAIQ